MSSQVHPDEIAEEKPLGTLNLFDDVHGKDFMRQASAKMDDLLPSPPTRNRGLHIDTNARLSNFAREKIFENGWSDTSLDLLESFLAECKKKATMYANAARQSRKKHRMLSIPSLVIASAATATSFFAAGSECSEETEASESLKITVAILTSVTAVLGGVAALYSFDSKTTACIAASGSFDSLAKKAQIQVYLTNNLRGPVEVVINDIAAEFCHLTNTSPLL